MMKKISVVAAVIKKNGLYFCAQRNKNGTLPLLWEFPGGKIEDGETGINALEREIREELQANIRIIKFLTTTEHTYDFAHIVLHAYLCELVEEEIRLIEHNDSLWLESDHLSKLEWAPADIPIIEYIINMEEEARNQHKIEKSMIRASNKIREINTNNLWMNLHHFDFALYNKKNVHLSNGSIINWDNRFIGNTAIQYEDNYIAIWNMDTIDTIDYDTLSASLIHEMFHAFQYEQQEKRWPDEKDGLFYEYHSLNLSIKLEEAKLLVRLLEKFDADTFDILLRSRVYRLQNFPSQFDYETKIEVVEGMAEFVELEALKELSLKKYNKRLEHLKKQIVDSNEYLKIRMHSYHIGSLFMTVCKDNNINIDHDISTETKTIFEILKKKNDYDALNIFKKDYFSQLIKIRDSKMNELFELKQTELLEHIQGPLEFVGFDPLNTLRKDAFLYCKHFVAYKKEKETVFFTKECIIKLKSKNEIEYIKYRK